ncbi:MAG: pyrroline-5-carboxylate reductase [Muribaculaceae bacterium]|nr:pyrroline-5-carboxylate reductase [Muribaculaceae bacterium]
MKIAIIGAGNMGGAIAAGLADSNYEITVANPSRPKLEALAEAHKSIKITIDNTEAAAGASVVFIATRPAACLDVIRDIEPVLLPEALVVTMAPGVDLAESAAAALRPVARIMPNTAIALSKSMTFVSFGQGVSEKSRAGLMDILGLLGNVAEIPENLFGPATALCSCGLAYALRYVRAASEGAVAMGFRPADAVSYIAATLSGAVAMLENGSHPEELIDRITTPGGTTIRGLLAMEKAGFTNAVVSGLLASSHE